MVKVKDILKVITYICVMTGYASVLAGLETHYSVAFGAMLLCAVYLDYRRIVQLPRWMLNVVSLGVIAAAVYKVVSSSNLVEPSLNALIILITIKLLEEKRFRDYMQIYAMCMFLVLGSTLLSLSALFLLYFSVLLALSTVSLVLLAYYSHDPEIRLSRENVKGVTHQAVSICAISIVASSVFFVILPRTNFPLLNFLNKMDTGRTGFSDHVALGEVSNIQEDNRSIFRAEMAPVDDARLYWRGIVMDEFDGKGFKSSGFDSGKRIIVKEGQYTTQTIYLEPYGNRYLFALDRPVSLTRRSVKGSDTLTYSTKYPLNNQIRYTVRSLPGEFLPQVEIDRDRFLQLPEGYSPKIERIVKELVASKPDEAIMNLYRFVKEGDFNYSLDDLPVSDNPLEDFVLVHRRGNCEYFASSLAVMLRMAGIPSRLVGGYRGGYYNPAGGYYMVLQKNAHVWVEAHVEGKGWLRLDPTPYSTEMPSIAYGDSMFMQFRLFADTFNYYWDKLVLSYDLNRQLEIWNRIRSSIQKPDIKIEAYRPDITRLLAFLLGILGVSAAGYLIVMGRKGHERRLISKFLRKMAGHGYKKDQCEGLEEFVSRVEREDIRSRASVFVCEFQKLYYRDCAFTRSEVARLEGCIREI